MFNECGVFVFYYSIAISLSKFLRVKDHVLFKFVSAEPGVGIGT